MQDNNPPYDTTFASSYQWSEPESDLKAALEILYSKADDHEVGLCPAALEEYQAVCCLLAGNPNCPAEVLAHLARCVSNNRILERVAGNPNVSEATLRVLAGFNVPEVRAAVAENINADDDTIRILAEDESIDVRFHLAENYQIPQTVIAILVMDDNPYVAHRAKLTQDRFSPQQRQGQAEAIDKFQRRDIRRAV